MVLPRRYHKQYQLSYVWTYSFWSMYSRKHVQFAWLFRQHKEIHLPAETDYIRSVAVWWTISKHRVVFI